MDVRCEKCQTEYELDESRLKPGGVTVKCTNCGHMFKIRKRTPTNVGLPTSGERTRPVSSKPPYAAGGARPGSVSDELPTVRATTDLGSGPTAERQWLIRLENGDTKSCRELATLQQWIVAGVVTRESLISRTGKTWKRLGDIAELGQYFVIADEARTNRARQPTGGNPVSTLKGYSQASAAGGTIVPDDEEGRTTGNFRARPRTTPPPPPGKTPSQPKANPLAQTEVAGSFPEVPPKRPPTNPPPIPANRQTAAWAAGDIKQSASMAQMPQGPQGGKLAAIPDEPAFAGRVRMAPGSEGAFRGGNVSTPDDDDDLLPGRTGSRAGLWIAILAILVIAGAAGVTYMFVFRQKETAAAKPPVSDAAAVVQAPPPADAAAVAPPPAIDAAPPPSAIDTARTELSGGSETKLHAALDALAEASDPPALAMRALLTTAIAQSELDRAGLLTDHAEADKLRKHAKQLVLDAVLLAQKAQKAAPADPAANLAFADVLRLQGKPARDVKRYLDAAAAKPDAEITRWIGLEAALVLERDGKLDDAQKALAAIDGPEAEPGGHAPTGGVDARVKTQLALVALAQNKAADARPLVDALLAAQPDHDVARALSKKLDTMVAKTDPLPPEDSGSGKGSGSAKQTVRPPPGGEVGGGDYDSLVAKATKLAESTNCAKAIDLYGKALEQKPNGVEALTGMGYCHIDAKQYASAFSNFRAALAVSPRYEPALSGIAEAYQQQGRKQDAIDAWHRVLDAYPGSAKAKRQLEILGDTGGGEGSAAPPPPPPAPAPTPAPAPAPAAGSGSG